MHRIVKGLLVLGLAGCADPLGQSADGEVTVTLEAEGLNVRNGRADAIYYAAIGENALILFAPCVRADCPRLEGGSSTRIGWVDIPAGEESPVIAFHWWEARVDASGDREPGIVHTIRVGP